MNQQTYRKSFVVGAVAIGVIAAISRFTPGVETPGLG